MGHLCIESLEDRIGVVTIRNNGPIRPPVVVRIPIETMPKDYVHQIRWRDIMDSMFDGLSVLDTRLRIQLWNKAAERITGYSSQEVVGEKCFLDIFSPLDGECSVKRVMVECVLLDDEVFFDHKGGHTVPVLFHYAPLYDRDENVAGVVGTFSAI